MEVCSQFVYESMILNPLRLPFLGISRTSFISFYFSLIMQYLVVSLFFSVQHCVDCFVSLIIENSLCFPHAHELFDKLPQRTLLNQLNYSCDQAQVLCLPFIIYLLLSCLFLLYITIIQIIAMNCITTCNCCFPLLSIDTTGV